VLLALGASMREGWENDHLSVLSGRVGGVFVMSGVSFAHYGYFTDVHWQWIWLAAGLVD
jgi:hypothetical protein